jgi:OFA family oxalate/formate antiporter-like MFS transporter
MSANRRGIAVSGVVIQIALGGVYAWSVFRTPLAEVLAGRSDRGLWWLYLTYGVIGGVGLGLAYIVPVAVLVKRFPDRRALITGIAVGGFGAGALVDGAGGARLIQSVGVLPTFAYLGAAFLIVTMVRGFFSPPKRAPGEGAVTMPGEKARTAA